jgi:hypothetical protein
MTIRKMDGKSFLLKTLINHKLLHAVRKCKYEYLDYTLLNLQLAGTAIQVGVGSVEMGKLL